MTVRFLLLVSFSGLLLSACGNEGESETLVETEVAAPIELENTSWQLVELIALGGHSFIPDDPADYTLNFRPDSRLTGKSDCNTYTAQWAVDGDSVAISDYRSTRSLCISGSLHNYYSLYLRDVTGVSLDAGRLAIVTATPDVRLTFQAAE